MLQRRWFRRVRVPPGDICVLHVFHFNVRFHFIFALALRTPTSGVLICPPRGGSFPGDIDSYCVDNF